MSVRRTVEGAPVDLLYFGKNPTRVFSPSLQAVALARRVLDAAAEAERSGGGVATLDGKPIYLPQIKQARTLVEQSELLSKSG